MSAPAPSLRLAPIAEWVQPVTLAGERLLPVQPVLADLLPDRGLRRGTVVAVDGSGALSLVLALVAEASVAGSWLAIVGAPSIGLAAAAEQGVVLERVVTVDRPEPGIWSAVVAALAEAVDLVMIAPAHRVKLEVARRLQARARERGAVLLHVEGRSWPEAPDARLTASTLRWEGIGHGHGTLRARQVRVEAVCRRDVVAKRRVDLWLPDPDGIVRVAAEAAADEIPRPERLRQVG